MSLMSPMNIYLSSLCSNLDTKRATWNDGVNRKHVSAKIGYLTFFFLLEPAEEIPCQPSHVSKDPVTCISQDNKLRQIPPQEHSPADIPARGIVCKESLPCKSLSSQGSHNESMRTACLPIKCPPTECIPSGCLPVKCSPVAALPIECLPRGPVRRDSLPRESLPATIVQAKMVENVRKQSERESTCNEFLYLCEKGMWCVVKWDCLLKDR